jgi:hypothetical protein
VQFTKVPFKLPPIGLIDNLDVSGKEFSPEILEKVNTVWLIINCDIWLIVERILVYLPSLSPSLAKKLHSRNPPCDVHTKLSCSPWHIDAIPEGDNATWPVSIK